MFVSEAVWTRSSSVPSRRLLVSQDSLAAEIEGTMRKELSLDDPDCEEQKYVWADLGLFLNHTLTLHKLLTMQAHTPPLVCVQKPSETCV